MDPNGCNNQTYWFYFLNSFIDYFYMNLVYLQASYTVQWPRGNLVSKMSSSFSGLNDHAEILSILSAITMPYAKRS
jgi:hypothetical protein